MENPLHHINDRLVGLERGAIVSFMLFLDKVKFLGSLMVSIDMLEAEKKISVQLELEITKEEHKKEKNKKISASW